MSKFKINFTKPIKYNLEKINKKDGILFSKEKKTNYLKSIYSSPKFNFQYVSEYSDKPLSKLIISLIPDWHLVDNIEFTKIIDLKDVKSVNPFHWVMEFSEILNRNSGKKNGFDVIVGNPPFIRIENIDEPERELYKRKYELAKERFDIFNLFYELCNDIISDQGYICLVSSNKFLKSKTAKGLRKFIKKNFSIREILNFNNYYAFRGIGIQTVLIFLKKTNIRRFFPYVSINDDNFKMTFSTMQLINNEKKNECLNDLFSIYQINDKELDNIKWDFFSKMNQKVILKIQGDSSIKLKEMIESNRQGVVTSANDVFLVNKETIKKYGIEKNFYYKIVKGNQLRRWKKILWDDLYIVYPYEYDSVNEETEIIDINKDLKICKYLKDNRVALNKRYCVTSGNKEWFELHDPVSPKYFLSKKIMFPDISLVPSFSLDLSSELYGLDTTYSIILKDDIYLYYVLAVLNSYVIELYVKNIFQTLGNAYRYKTFLVNVIPIYDPKKVEPDIFKQITNISKNLFENYSLSEEKELNLLIKELYGIDAEEYEFLLKELNKD